MRQRNFMVANSLDHHFRIDLRHGFNIGYGSRYVLFGQKNEILVARQENKKLKIRKTFRNESLFFWVYSFSLLFLFKNLVLN